MTRANTPELPNPVLIQTDTSHNLSRSGDGLVRGHSTANNNGGLRARDIEVGLVGMNTNTLLAEQVNEDSAGLVALVGGKGGLEVLVLLHVLNILVKQVSGVKRSALGLGVELSAEDGARVVDETFVRLIVEVGEVLPPLAGQSGGVDGVSVVLRSDVALAGAQVESGDVVGTVTVLELDSLSTSSKGDQLVTHADAHNRDLRGLEQLAEVVHSLCAVGWVTGAVGDEDTVKVVGDLVDGVVIGEAGDAGTARDKAAKNVLLDTAVDEGNVHVTEGRADVERCLCRNTTDEVDSLRVNEGLVLIGIVLLADCDTSKGGTLHTEVCYDLASVDTRDGGNALTSTPLSERLNGGPVAVLQGVVLDDNTRGLDVG